MPYNPEGAFLGQVPLSNPNMGQIFEPLSRWYIRELDRRSQPVSKWYIRELDQRAPQAFTQETGQGGPATNTKYYIRELDQRVDQPQARQDIPSIDCSHLGPYAFWDGRQCRSSGMNRSGGSLVSSAMNFGTSEGSMPAGNAAFGGEAPGAFSMSGRQRFPVVNL